MMVRKSGSNGVTAAALGLMVAFMLVFAAAPAFGSEALKWNSCKETPGKGSYEDVACSKALSGGNFSWSALSGATPFKSQGSSHRIKSVQSGVITEISCDSVSGEGQLDNGEAGALVNAYHVTYNNCSVTAPAGKGCAIKGKSIIFNTITGKLNSPMSQEVLFTPGTGEALAQWSMEGCSISALNHWYELKGNYKGVVENTSSSLRISRASSESNLRMSGQVAWIEGLNKIETSSGEALKLGL